MFERWRLPRLRIVRAFPSFYGFDVRLWPDPHAVLDVGPLRFAVRIGHADGCECEWCLPF